VPTGGDRLAAWLADPGLRSRLPDSALTPDLLKMRQANAYNAAPAAPGSSYTNKQLNDLVGMLTQQKYGQAEQALNTQASSVPQWFQAYRDQVAAAQAAQQQAATQQVASLQQMATQAAGDTGGLAGAPMDAEAAARAQAAAQIRGAGVSNQAALAQNLGANQNAYLTNLGLLSNGQQQAAQQHVADQIAQLLQDKGAFKTTQRQQILGDEADAALKNALTEAQVGSTNANAAATQASATKTKVETKKTQAEQDYFDKHGYYPSTGKPAAKTPDTITSGPFAGYTKTQVAKMPQARKDQIIAAAKKTSGKGGEKDPYGNTPKQRAASNDALDKALIYARQAVKDKKHGPSLAGDWKKLANALVVGFNVNPTFATAAAQQVVLGHIGPNTSKTLKKRGTTIPKATKPIQASVVDDAISSVGQAISGLS
jgi:hypothetical protein